MNGVSGHMPRWAREVLGAAVAVAISVAVVAAVAASARSELLFRDGDSLVTTLVVRSLDEGQAQDWALSTVLFLPETAMLALLWPLRLDVNATLALAGVVNLVALYGALRVAAGRPGGFRMPVAGALLAFAGLALLAVSEQSPSRDALELASLVATTTYYSATVIAVVLTVGLARRGLEPRSASVGGSGVTAHGDAAAEATHRDPGGPGAERVMRGPAVGVALVAAASVLTNPLFAAWATVPLGIVLAVVWIHHRSRAAAWLAGALVAGTVAGFVCRAPLWPLIANTGAGYADPSQWLMSLHYYGSLLAGRASEPWGAASVLLLLAAWISCVAATVQLVRSRDVSTAVVAACGWVMPLVVVVGAVALGTHAARYLQPAAFAPMLGLVVLPGLLAAPRRPGRRPARRDQAIWREQNGSAAEHPVSTGFPDLAKTGLALGAAAVVLALAAGLGIPRIAAVANAPDADLGCVTAWVDESGRTGAGQFWTVRLPKAHLEDPRRLVQVDHQLRGYAWLVNRDDFAGGEVSFLVADAQSVPFDLPGELMTTDAAAIACGRYTIYDFGSRMLSLGPQRS